MDYKVETKNCLWKVVLSSGCYSDYNEDHFVFSGNSEEEVWAFVKKYVVGGKFAGLKIPSNETEFRALHCSSFTRS